MGPSVVWLQGHMDLMQSVGNGPLVQMSPTGKLMHAPHLHHQGGIYGSNLKAHHLVLMMVIRCTVLYHRTVEEVGAG